MLIVLFHLNSGIISTIKTVQHPLFKTPPFSPSFPAAEAAPLKSLVAWKCPRHLYWAWTLFGPYLGPGNWDATGLDEHFWRSVTLPSQLSLGDIAFSLGKAPYPYSEESPRQNLDTKSEIEEKCSLATLPNLPLSLHPWHTRFLFASLHQRCISLFDLEFTSFVWLKDFRWSQPTLAISLWNSI